MRCGIDLKGIYLLFLGEEEQNILVDLQAVALGNGVPHLHLPKHLFSFSGQNKFQTTQLFITE